MTYGGYAIFMPYVGVEAKLWRSENVLYDWVQDLCVARRQFLNQVRKEGEIDSKSEEEGDLLSCTSPLPRPNSIL